MTQDPLIYHDRKRIILMMRGKYINLFLKNDAHNQLCNLKTYAKKVFSILNQVLLFWWNLQLTLHTYIKLINSFILKFPIYDKLHI